MEFIESLALIFSGALLLTLVLPWVNLVRLSNVKSEIRRLQDELAKHRREFVQGQEKGIDASLPVEWPEKVKEPEVVPEKLLDEGDILSPVPGIVREQVEAEEDFTSESVLQSKAANSFCDDGKEASPTLSESGDAKSDWFSKIAIWVGGVALLMAGFFMVKYSIDSGWLRPSVRLWATTIFSGLLCLSGVVVSSKVQVRANERIGQALSGAGIACLYFVAYAAVHLYHFINNGEGFLAMVGVTILAVLLSLRNGAPIALMGLLGGLVTPLLMRSDAADTAMLFGYLFILLCAAQVLCLRRGWWGLLLVSLVGVYLWSGVIIFANMAGIFDNLEGAMLFVLGVCASNTALILSVTNREMTASSRAMMGVFRGLVWVGGFGQALALVWFGEFAAVDLTLFYVLALGALLLAVLREGIFRWAAWLGLMAVLLAELLNAGHNLLVWLVVPVCMVLLFTGIGHWRGLCSTYRLEWRILSMIALLTLTPVLYFNREFIVEGGLVPFEAFWLVMSLFVAFLLGLLGEHLLRSKESEMIGVYQAFAIFTVCFGLWEYVAEMYLQQWVGGLLLVSAIYWKCRRLPSANLVCGVLAAGWSLLMLDLARAAFAYYFAEDFGRENWPAELAAWAWVSGSGGFLLALRFYWSEWSVSVQRFAAWWSGIVVVLGLVELYRYFDVAVLEGAYSRALVEGGLTALFALLAISVRVSFRHSSGASLVSAVLATLSVTRIVLLHLEDTGASGPNFFFNALFLQFGLPFICVGVLAWIETMDAHRKMSQAYQLVAMLLGFVWSTFLVKDFFGGSGLFERNPSSAELYAYSVTWLLLAIVYQTIGLLRNQKCIHVGSLVLLLVTVGKVFLIDAADLEGLYRVLSFLGLGLALIGIGFFYNKVIFGRECSHAD